MQSLSIIYEDNHVIVVIKAPNDLSCPDDKTRDDAAAEGDNLLDQIRAYLAEQNGKKTAFVGLVHRLDRVTGGVMCFAKTSKAASRLSEQIRSGEFQKTYLAVTVGTPKLREGTLVHHLLKNENKNVVEIVPFATTGAKRAELSYTVSNKTPLTQSNLALLNVNLATGRSHQIRVQLASMGTPIWGDAKYGKSGRIAPYPKPAETESETSKTSFALALWAYDLVFVHPVSGDHLRFTVYPPETAPWNLFDFDRRSHKTANSQSSGGHQ